MRGQIIFSLCTILGILVGCNRPTEEKENTDHIEQKIEKQSKEESISEAHDLRLVVNDIPSPMEIATILEESKEAFHLDLINPVENADYYKTELKQAFNLGIYGADLNYVIIYNEHKQVLKYLFVMKYIADAVNIAEALDEPLLHRIENNIRSKDSLIYLTLPIYKSLDNFLHKNKRDDIAAMILTGAWLEGTFIAAQVIGNNNQNEKNQLIYHKLTQQGKALSNIIDVLSQYQHHSEELHTIVMKLEDIQQVFEEKESEIVSFEEVQEIVKKLEILRNELTQI